MCVYSYLCILCLRNFFAWSCWCASVWCVVKLGLQVGQPENNHHSFAKILPTLNERHTCYKTICALISLLTLLYITVFVQLLKVQYSGTLHCGHPWSMDIPCKADTVCDPERILCIKQQDTFGAITTFRALWVGPKGVYIEGFHCSLNGGSNVRAVCLTLKLFFLEKEFLNELFIPRNSLLSRKKLDVHTFPEHM